MPGKGRNRLSRGLQKEPPADSLVLAPWDPPWTSDPQNRRIWNVCCFKTLSLWSCVTAANRKLIHSPDTKEELNSFPRWSGHKLDQSEDCEHLGVSLVVTSSRSKCWKWLGLGADWTQHQLHQLRYRGTHNTCHGSAAAYLPPGDSLLPERQYCTVVDIANLGPDLSPRRTSS